jgi:hypothetical protein
VAWNVHPVGICDAPVFWNAHPVRLSGVLWALYDTYIYKVYLPLLYIGIATMYGNPYWLACSGHNERFIENN